MGWGWRGSGACALLGRLRLLKAHADHASIPRRATVAVAPAKPTAFVAGAAKIKEDDFPDLAVAAKVKESKKDKKKKAAKQTLSLTDFLKSDVGGGVPTAFGASRRLGASGGGGGDVDVRSLPTAPRPRAEGEESAGPMGGGFREYGGETRGAAPCALDASSVSCCAVQNALVPCCAGHKAGCWECAKHRWWSVWQG